MSQFQPDPEKVGFDFIKSNLFRVIHADGVWGGVGPRGNIQMGFYSERFPIPRRVEMEIKEGRVGDEISRDARSDIVREVEAEVIMNLQTAKALKDWLTTKIDEATKIAEAAS